MVRIAKTIAFFFRLLNFFFDCFQTWQYTGGGGMGSIVAGGVAWWQGLPAWAIIAVTIVAFIVILSGVAVVVNLITGKGVPSYEKRRWNRLPRLAYNIHKRICAIRERVVKHTDWNSVDRSKMIEPFANLLLDASVREGKGKLDDDAIVKGAEKLNKAGGAMHGSPSVIDTYMKDSNTSLEKTLQKDICYRTLMARLDDYKPYPRNTIRDSVQLILDSSLSFNNVILWLQYSPKDSPLVETLKAITNISDVEIEKMHVTNENAEKIMNSAIDVRLTTLREQVDSYLKEVK